MEEIRTEAEASVASPMPERLPRLLIPPPLAGRVPSTADWSWSLLVWVGAAFLLLGAVDLGLVWFPPDFGHPEWEFGTVTAVFDGLPVPVLGLAMVMAGAAARERRGIVGLAVAITAVFFIIVLGSLFLYATTIPMALGSTEDPNVRLGLTRAVIKTSSQGLVYLTLFLLMSVKGSRRLLRPLPA